MPLIFDNPSWYPSSRKKEKKASAPFIALKKGAHTTMYTISIQAEAQGPLYPRELKNPELAELTVEGTVACCLENLFTLVNFKNVSMSLSSQTANKKEANGPTYTIQILIEADASVLPYELKNTVLVEMIVESAVGCSLQDLYTEVIMKDVTISRSPREVEQDWDTLLSQRR